jgi:hypothetical protein
MEPPISKIAVVYSEPISDLLLNETTRGGFVRWYGGKKEFTTW